jgi:hypothetical protein
MRNGVSALGGWQLTRLMGSPAVTLCEDHGTWSAVASRPAVAGRSLDDVLVRALTRPRRSPP